MNYSRGEIVSVKDFKRRTYVRRVCEDRGAIVFITSDEVFRQLEKGESELWPIGVPKKDVSVVRGNGVSV